MRNSPAFILSIPFLDEGVCFKIKLLSYLKLSCVSVAFTIFRQVGDKITVLGEFESKSREGQ
jgi:hypothetical protein